MGAEISSETLVSVYQLHGVTFQNTEILLLTPL